MKFNINKEKLKNMFGGDKKTKLILAAGIIGILLIMLSEFIPNSDKSNDNVKQSEETGISSDDTDEYKNQIESEITEILSKINGVGECEVMVTVEGTTEYVYAENLSEYNDSDGDKVSGKHENNVVMVEQNGEKQALVKKIIKPKINGVVIVCEGGDDLKVSERVLKAASTALNISASRICVEGKTE